MKKLLLSAVCAMALTMSCNNKGKTEAPKDKDSTEAVIDSIIEENDTTPLPMFLIGNDGKYMQMLYWSHVEEPQKPKEEEGDEMEWFELSHKSWELQEMFRRNAAQYTNLITGDKVVKVKFVDEVLKDPDGETPSIGQIHSRQQIPSLCARFEYVNPKDKGEGNWGLVIATDSYLSSRKRLDVKSCQSENYDYPKLPADIVKQLETRYGMKAERSFKTSIIGDRYTMGAVEFKGEYKNAPKDKYDADRKFALALEVLIDSNKVYTLEKLGYHDEQYGNAWNADAEGYIPNSITVAFEGLKGLELCYTHGAPESFCTGMLFPREGLQAGDGKPGMGKLIEIQYEIYQTLIDEALPVWKKDIAEMRRLFLEQDPGENKHFKLTKYAHFYLDYEHNWIWMRDSTDQHGAFFVQNDDKFVLIGVETPRLKPYTMEAGGIEYLQISGSAGGPSTYREVYAFKDGKQIERFTALHIYDEIDESSLNGKTLSKEQAEAYIAKLPAPNPINAYFTDINE